MLERSPGVKFGDHRQGAAAEYISLLGGEVFAKVGYTTRCNLPLVDSERFFSRRLSVQGFPECYSMWGGRFHPMLKMDWVAYASIRELSVLRVDVFDQSREENGAQRLLPNGCFWVFGKGFARSGGRPRVA